MKKPFKILCIIYLWNKRKKIDYEIRETILSDADEEEQVENEEE